MHLQHCPAKLVIGIIVGAQHGCAAGNWIVYPRDNSIMAPTPTSQQTTTAGQNPQRTLTEVGSECFSSWVTYFRSSQWEYPIITKTFNTTRYFETIEMLAPGTAYTTCDGIPRFRPTGSPTATVRRVVSVVQTDESGAVEGPALPNRNDTLEPSCRPDLQDCRMLWSAYDQDAIAVAAGIGRIGIPISMCPQYERCNLETGYEVVLIYWPEEYESRDICAANGEGAAITVSSPTNNQPPRIISTTAITFKGTNMRLVEQAIRGQNDSITPQEYLPTSVLYGDFTFTSPTVYIAHHPISKVVRTVCYERESRNGPVQCDFTRGFGTSETTTQLKPAGIMAVSSSDVFSQRPLHLIANGLEYASLVANGEFDPLTDRKTRENQWDYTMLPLNFMHLQNPVPASIYYDARSTDCWGKQSHCGTITDDTYRPVLSIQRDFWTSLIPKGRDCIIPLVVDPPIVLSKIKPTQAEPTLALQSAAIGDPARPGSHVGRPHSNPTAAAASTGGDSARGEVQGNDIKDAADSRLGSEGNHASGRSTVSAHSAPGRKSGSFAGLEETDSTSSGELRAGIPNLKSLASKDIAISFLQRLVLAIWVGILYRRY